jgi:hypothetical protein
MVVVVSGRAGQAGAASDHNGICLINTLGKFLKRRLVSNPH